MIMFFFLLSACQFLSPNMNIKEYQCGDVVNELEGIPIYYNSGLHSCGEGRHMNDDGTYSYGMKWQCVEFVRRFYKQYFDHAMPEKYGNAIDYFDFQLKHGEINQKRALRQFQNGGSEKPQKYDLLVCNYPLKYGHVAIIAEVGTNYIVVAQQNTSEAFQRMELKNEDQQWTILEDCAGFLRIP